MPAKGKTQEEPEPFEPPKFTKTFLHSPEYKDRDYWGKHFFIKVRRPPNMLAVGPGTRPVFRSPWSNGFDPQDCIEYWRAKEDSENAKRQETNWMKEMAEHHMKDAPGTGHAWGKQKKRDAAAIECDEDVQELDGAPGKQQQQKKKRKQQPGKVCPDPVPVPDGIPLQ